MTPSSVPTAPFSVPRPSQSPNTVPSGSLAMGPDARVQQLTAQVVRARQDLVAAQVELRTARGEANNYRAELSVAKARISELEAEVEKLRAAPAAAGADDLKRIKGIGPKFEKILHAAGITSLSQVAAWTDGDIDETAKKIGIKADRIRREDWVGKAKSLTGSG
jgi:predicted flap endonuclease-1-like 5' DNA nuclease